MHKHDSQFNAGRHFFFYKVFPNEDGSLSAQGNWHWRHIYQKLSRKEATKNPPNGLGHEAFAKKNRSWENTQNLKTE